MAQIKEENVKGVIRNSDKSHTIVTTSGERVKVDNGTANSLLRRLDKDRSKMEKAGIVEEKREPEQRRGANEVNRDQIQRDRRLAEELRRRR